LSSSEMMRVCVLVLALALVNASLHGAVPKPSNLRPANLQAAAVVHEKRITPELDPVSDHKFFKADYPDDRRPQRYHDFGYPYPTVQDSEDYDKDYVEDKNDDGGYWTAQMHYDALKNKLFKEKDELKRALIKEQEEEREFQKAVDDEAAAEKKSKAAEAHENDMDKKHDEAIDALENTKKKIDGSADHVEGEVTDLESCKKQLLAARKKLKSLLEEKAQAEKDRLAREAAAANAEQKEAAGWKKVDELEKKVKEEKKEHESSLKSYAEELEDVKKAEAALEKAATDLRKFRHADPDGGVYETKSGAAGLTGASALVLAVASMLC